MGFSLQKKIQIWRTGHNQRWGDGFFKRKDFRVENHSVAISGLNPAFQGYRLVHISDIHLGQWLTAERLEGVVDLINQQSPDLVAITGDFFSFVLDSEADGLVRALKRLTPSDATVAVLGNHDHWLGADRVRGVLSRCKITDLSNDVLTLTRNDATLHIAGVDDVMVDMQRLDLVMERLPPLGPAILLVHEPDFADISAGTGRFALQLSGHSHGGQIVLPRLGTPIRAKHFRRYPLGRYQVGDMVQYTSRGLGTNLFWSRINCPPEVAVFTLQTEDVA